MVNNPIILIPYPTHNRQNFPLWHFSCFTYTTVNWLGKHTCIIDGHGVYQTHLDQYLQQIYNKQLTEVENLIKTILKPVKRILEKPRFEAQTASSSAISYTPGQSSSLKPTQKKLQFILKTAFSEHCYEFSLNSDGLTAWKKKTRRQNS